MALYKAEPEKKKAAVRALYKAEPEKKKAAVRAHHKAQPDKKKAADRAYYYANVAVKKEAARAAYRAESEKKKATFKAYYKANRAARLKYFRKYHCFTKKKPLTKARYRLTQPTQLVVERYVSTIRASLRSNAEVISQLEETFKARHGAVADNLSRENLKMAVSRLAAQRLVVKPYKYANNRQDCCLAV